MINLRCKNLEPLCVSRVAFCPCPLYPQKRTSELGQCTPKTARPAQEGEGADQFLIQVNFISLIR
jgi:hypothetical protein